jgi:hypothetical protein
MNFTIFVIEVTELEQYTPMSMHLFLRNKLIYNQLIKIAFMLLFVVLSSKVSSQVNIKIGYNLDYSSFQSHNALLKSYNESNSWLTQEFNNVGFLNGVQIGARLRNEFAGIDISWERTAAERNASGVNPSNLTVNQNLAYKLNRYSVGFEVYPKIVGIGANISYERFSISNSVDGLEAKNQILKEDRFSNRFYLIFTASGTERLGISLQPYVSIPWSHYNISPLKSYLDVRTDQHNIQQNLHFGFSLVFYNGPQR